MAAFRQQKQADLCKFKDSQVYTIKPCGGVNRFGPQRFMYLNAWP